MFTINLEYLFKKIIFRLNLYNINSVKIVEKKKT